MTHVYVPNCRMPSPRIALLQPAPGTGPRPALRSACAGATFVGTQNGLLHVPPQLNLLPALLGQELHSLMSPQVMSPHLPVSRASQPLLSPSHYGATRVPRPAGCFGLQLLLPGRPVLLVLQRHLNPHLSRHPSEASTPQLLGEVGSASMGPHWTPRCLSAGLPLTALPVHTPVSSATTHVNCYSLPANPITGAGHPAPHTAGAQ